MDTNKMRDLKALAEAATQSHGARRVEVDHNGVHVIGDGSWKILSAWHTPDGKGAQNAEFAAAASPATVLALLAEIERLATSRSKKERELEQELETWRHGPFCWTCGDTGDVHDITGEWRGECDCLSAQLINANRERDQLKAENEALRSLVLSALEEGNGRLSSGGNAPGHCHEVPGVWDRGNGDRSGTPCGWCRIRNAAQAMAKEAPNG
ncbi:hypothetical protein [Pseudomonas sp. SWI44]|uniref:hypothetical protein n=1 Tax=Pseudomonas sp. SWI44 TaxID=2083053 RepID=UPI0015AE138B|nr:hypothetical protein [Pseudomonas sp. SWI44]